VKFQIILECEQVIFNNGNTEEVNRRTARRAVKDAAPYVTLMAFPPTVSRSAMQLAIYLASRTVPSEPAIETDLERYDPAFHFVMPISLCIKIKKIVAEAGW
jgi:hypothetical protein